MKLRLIVLSMMILNICNPLNAGQTIVIGPASYPITTMPLSDFNSMPLDSQLQWLAEREGVIERFSSLLEDLNSSDAEEMIKKIKRDRCCSMGFNSVGGVVLLCSTLTSVLLPPLVLPTWISYITGGASALGGLLLYRAGIFKENAITGQKDAEATRSELIRDYYEKKIAYDANRRRQEELIYWQSRALGRDGRPVLLLPSQPQANLAAYRNGYPFEDVEAVEVARPVSSDVVGSQESQQGRQPINAPTPVELPAGHVWAYKVPVKQRVRKKQAASNRAPPAQQPLPPAQKGEEQGDEEFQVVVEK